MAQISKFQGERVMVRLHIEVSHRHILPLLILYCILAVTILTAGGILNEDVWYIIASCVAQFFLAIMCFYCGIAVSALFVIKESSIGFGFSQATTRRVIVGFGVFLSYLVFVFRVYLISILEAAIVCFMFSNPMDNWPHMLDQLDVNENLWFFLAIAFMLAHTLVERHNLGRTALIFQEETKWKRVTGKYTKSKKES